MPNRVTQSLRQCLIPSTTDAFQKARTRYHERYSPELEKLRRYETALQDILKTARKYRLAVLEQIMNQLTEFNQEHECDVNALGRDPESSLTPRTPSNATVVSLPTSLQEQLLKQLCGSIEITDTLRRHLKDVKEDISTYDYLIKTQATMDFTNYRGIHDWSERTLEANSYISGSLITISLAGSGIVYATIFSANRGDVGMMAFTFPLFSIGFLIPVIVQIMLKWGARRSRRATFARQTFWRVFVAIWLTFAVLAVTVAVTILNLTVFGLQKNKESVTDHVPRAAGIIAFAFCGIIFVFLIGVFILALFAKGFKRFVQLLFGSARKPVELHSYDFA